VTADLESPTDEAARCEPELSLVIPVYDEEDSLDLLYGELVRALECVALPSEIVFVDDGSRDASLAALRVLERKDPRVRVISFARNRGQSAALDAGFRAARGAVVATLDADLQNDPADLSRLLPHLTHADVVNGIRTPRRDSLSKRLASALANRIRNRLTGVCVTDVGCSLRVMRTSYLRKIELYRGLHRFLPTLLAMEGARLVEVEVSHRPRRHGTSKYGLSGRAVVGLVDLVAVCWKQRRGGRGRVKA